MKRRSFIKTITASGIGSAITLPIPGFATEEGGHNTPVGDRESQPLIGMNLAGPCDWNTELPFVDVFRMSRKWISQRQGYSWGQGPELALDNAGYITRLDDACFAETPLCTIDGGHYPAGTYTVLYDGKGSLTFSGTTTIREQQPGRILVDVDSSRGGFFLQLRATDPDDHVRNIRVIMPGFENSYESNPWHPDFLDRWKMMSSLRFMDFMHTNGSKIKTWGDRPKMNDASWGPGVPLEMMCDLCNRTGIDPWFCMPHLADDDYVRRFAEQTRELLDADRKVYVEYSNEVWNGQFQQSKYAGEIGMQLGLADKPWEAAWSYTAYRSVQMFSIWSDVLGSTDRLVRVLPTQAANPYVSRRVVGFRDAWRNADVLAIAPYISMNVSKDEADRVADLGLDGIFDRVENDSLPKAIGWIQQQKAVADEFGLKLTAYEAGQHLVGVGGGENNERLCQLFYEANHSARMGEIYRMYFDAWRENGADLMCMFSSIGRWSKWGSWGLMEHYDSVPDDYPKYQATIERAHEWNG